MLHSQLSEAPFMTDTISPDELKWHIESMPDVHDHNYNLELKDMEDILIKLRYLEPA